MSTAWLPATWDAVEGPARYDSQAEARRGEYHSTSGWRKLCIDQVSTCTTEFIMLGIRQIQDFITWLCKGYRSVFFLFFDFFLAWGIVNRFFSAPLPFPKSFTDCLLLFVDFCSFLFCLLFVVLLCFFSCWLLLLWKQFLMFLMFRIMMTVVMMMVLMMMMMMMMMMLLLLLLLVLLVVVVVVVVVVKSPRFKTFVNHACYVM